LDLFRDSLRDIKTNGIAEIKTYYARRNILELDFAKPRRPPNNDFIERCNQAFNAVKSTVNRNPEVLIVNTEPYTKSNLGNWVLLRIPQEIELASSKKYKLVGGTNHLKNKSKEYNAYIKHDKDGTFKDVNDNVVNVKKILSSVAVYEREDEVLPETVPAGKVAPRSRGKLRSQKKLSDA
jgi:hypothetical protein